MTEDIMPKSWYKSSKPHYFCPGCGHAIALKQLGYAIDELKIEKETVLGIDIGCSLLAWNFLSVDTIQTHHGRTIPVMVGYKKIRGYRIAFAYMGDGGGYAIGLQSLIHCAIRNDPIIVILINNQNYAMTGGQMAPTTQIGEVTTTTPIGKPEELGQGFRGPEMLKGVSNKNAYIARFSVANPLSIREALKNAVQTQIEKESFSFLEILSICPTNWKTNAKESLDRVKRMSNYYKLGKL